MGAGLCVAPTLYFSASCGVTVIFLLVAFLMQTELPELRTLVCVAGSGLEAFVPGRPVLPHPSICWKQMKQE